MNSPYNHLNDKGFLSNEEVEAKLTKMKDAATENQQTTFWKTLFFLMPTINAWEILSILKSHPSMNRYSFNFPIKKWYCLVVTPLFWLLFWCPIIMSLYQIVDHKNLYRTQQNSQQFNLSNSNQQQLYINFLLLLGVSFGTFTVWRLFFMTFNKNSISYTKIIDKAIESITNNAVEDLDAKREEIKNLRTTIYTLRLNGVSSNPIIQALEKRIQQLQNLKESQHKKDDDHYDEYDAKFPLPK